VLHWFVVSFMCNTTAGCARLPEMHVVPKENSSYTEVEACRTVAQALGHPVRIGGKEVSWVEAICEPRNAAGSVVSWKVVSAVPIDSVPDTMAACPPAPRGTMGGCGDVMVVVPEK
jgi:hypothetical protein